MLAKGLKYAPPPELNQEKTIIECESIIQKLENENDKKRIRWEVGNVVDKILKKNFETE